MRTSEAETIKTSAARDSRFSPADQDLIRQSFLRKFGMTEQPKQAFPALPLPSYIWNIYDKVRDGEEELVRHYYPHRISQDDLRTISLLYNLTVTVKNSSSERVVRADLKLKLSKGYSQRRVKVYDIDQRNSEIRRLIDSKLIQPPLHSDHQWVDMDVSEALMRKRLNPEMVELAVDISDGNLASEPSTSTHTVSSIPYSRAQAAALVVYIEGGEEDVKVWSILFSENL
ncbi:hypothetical protein AB6A40_006485 [Gnathostoma spinigerum]|uniref:TGF-beta propeptide domain-containing protein n=1 Tax=Gnathostoma spinigerum TaxID=75299 RepID=A0ABD6EJ52_9BILA